MKACARKFSVYLGFLSLFGFSFISLAIAGNSRFEQALEARDSSQISGHTTQVQLAHVYNNQSLQDYLVSEKYDGIRAIWKNKQLRTRKGNIIHAPKWFTQNLPDLWLDGELWYQRGNFEYVASTVSKNKPIDSEWQNIRYMVFDAPAYNQPFIERYQRYSELIARLALSHIVAVEQFEVQSSKALYDLLENVTIKKAEGLMLQNKYAMFADGRSGNLFKLKQFMDAEARVIQHMRGQGKYKDMLGALLVEYQNSDGTIVQFKIGSGFTDEERRNPPPLGSIVTFKYHGYTQRGVPRFASFMRVRQSN